jgi:hypothetical protein
MKKINILFISCFLIIISLPLISIDRKSIVSEKENRVLAAFPALLRDDGTNDRVNIRSIPKEFDSYINDRFGFRNTIVSLTNALNKTSKTINGNVIIGKNDWLFYSRVDDGNNIGDFFKLNLFTDTEVEQFIEKIEKRREWCNKNGIQFLFLIAPNKHNVYPEYYPFERPDGITRTGQIMSALPEGLKDCVIFPLDTIIQHKTDGMPLYFETDTHWNMAGAYYAFDLLFNRIKQLFPKITFPEISFITDISYDSSGDIVPMSGFTSYGKRTIPNMYPTEGWGNYYQYKKNDGVNGVIINSDNKSLPKAIIFRDSFFSALEPFTSTLFSSAEYNWRQFSEAERNTVLKNKPDIIIWEVVERSISGIPYLKWD